MSHHSYRIPVEETYALAVGRAVYNYAYLEWCVINLVALLDPSSGYPLAVTAEKITGGAIATRLQRAAISADARYRATAVKIAQAFEPMPRLRNDVLHAHPFTTTAGNQALSRQPIDAAPPVLETPDDLHRAARRFEDLAIEVNDFYWHIRDSA